MIEDSRVDKVETQNTVGCITVGSLRNGPSPITNFISKSKVNLIANILVYIN